MAQEELSAVMFLIRCFKLEKEYEEYINRDSSTQKLTEKDQTERKPRSETILEESREHIAALPSESASHPHSLQKVGRANSVAHTQFKSNHHTQLGRSVSAGIYEDDVLLVNYHKFGRDGVPYVFDGRKTRKSSFLDFTQLFLVVLCLLCHHILLIEFLERSDRIFVT